MSDIAQLRADMTHYIRLKRAFDTLHGALERKLTLMLRDVVAEHNAAGRRHVKSVEACLYVPERIDAKPRLSLVVRLTQEPDGERQERNARRSLSQTLWPKALRVLRRAGDGARITGYSVVRKHDPFEELV